MKTWFLIALTLLFTWQLYEMLPDLLAVRIQDVKVFDTQCVEMEDGMFYPKVAFDGGEELLTKEGYNNPDKCTAKYGAIKGSQLPLYRKALGGLTLDPSVSYKIYVRLFILIVATFYVYRRLS